MSELDLYYRCEELAKRNEELCKEYLLTREMIKVQDKLLADYKALMERVDGLLKQAVESMKAKQNALDQAKNAFMALNPFTRHQIGCPATDTSLDPDDEVRMYQCGCGLDEAVDLVYKAYKAWEQQDPTCIAIAKWRKDDRLNKEGQRCADCGQPIGHHIGKPALCPEGISR